MIRIGVLGTSSIAERRMIPAIMKESSFQYVGVAYSTKEEMGFSGPEDAFWPMLEKKKLKASRFQEHFCGRIWEGYQIMLSDSGLDAVYIALPPALHFRWAKMAIESGKHVLLEKPFTTSVRDTEALIHLAQKKKVAVIENYGFPLHAQMDLIRQWIAEGAIGELRQVRSAFCFPHRDSHDFRYCRELGGGALLDCGGYTLKAGTTILGPDVEVLAAFSQGLPGHEVDMMGNVLLRNPKGVCAQLVYGMDHDYRCELEIWGNKGSISASRIFTAPDGFPAPVELKTASGIKKRTASDDQFQRIVQRFKQCINDEMVRLQTMEEVLLQGKLTQRVRDF